MKTTLCFGFSVLLAIVFISCGSGTLSTSWEKVLSLTNVPGVAGDENSAGTHFVTFLDDKTAVAVNFLNQFYVTGDGGASWKKTIIPSNLSCQQPEVMDERTVFVGGPRSVVSLTADGGESWRRIDGTGQLFILSVTDAYNGFFANYAKLAAWSGHPDLVKDVPLPADLGKGVMAVAALPDQSVFLLSQNRRLLFSSDLGQTWTEKKLPGLTDRQPVFEYLVSTMRFTDADHGLIFTFDKKQDVWIAFTTEDGGGKWTVEPVLQGKEGRSAIGPRAEYVTIMPARSDETVIVLKRKPTGDTK